MGSSRPTGPNLGSRRPTGPSLTAGGLNLETIDVDSVSQLLRWGGHGVTARAGGWSESGSGFLLLVAMASNLLVMASTS